MKYILIMFLFFTSHLYCSENDKISKAEFIYCLDFFIRNKIDYSDSVYFKELIAKNQHVYDKYMKTKKVTFSGKDDVCQL